METAASTASGMRVLVVDDEEGVRLGLSRLLAADGFDVAVVDGVAAARRALGERPPHLVMTDLRLGDGTGLEVQASAHALDPDLPVIFLSGADDQPAAIAALESGAVRFLTKPARAAQILEAVRAALRLRDMARRGASGTWRDLRAAEHDRGKLDRAIDGLYMVFQPVVSWSLGRVVAYEALVRSTEPSLARPDRLLAAAERAGRVVELGRRIRALVAACVPALPGDADVFVNLHADELGDPSLIAADAPLAAHAARVVFEITERAALADHIDPAAHIAALRAQGYRVAVDDLGAGYASLAMLAELRPDVVKIDMSLVRGVRKDPTRQIVLRALMQLGTQLGIATVAEGLEALDDLSTVIEAGGELFQGYLFARPATAPPAVDLPALRDVLADQSHRLATGRIAPPRAPIGPEATRTLCRDASAPLYAIAALAHALQGGASLDDQLAIAGEILDRVGQIDAMLAALAAALA